MSPSALVAAEQDVPRGVARVLIATDLGEASERAVDMGLALAARFHANVVLLHAHAPVALAVDPSLVADAELRRATEARFAHCLTDAHARYARVEGLLLDGTPVAGILAGIDRGDADLVVMATHARRGLPRLVLGSTTEQVLRRAPIPVLAVPPPAADRDEHRSEGGRGRRDRGGEVERSSHSAGPCFDRIVVATDFSARARLAVRYAAQMAARLGAEITLVHAHDASVCHHPEEASAALERERLTAELTRSSLAEAEGTAGAASGAVGALLVEGGASVGILEAAARSKAELIVIGTQGRSGLGRLVLGSVAEQVLRSAVLPVLTVSPRARGKV